MSSFLQVRDILRFGYIMSVSISPLLMDSVFSFLLFVQTMEKYVHVYFKCEKSLLRQHYVVYGELEAVIPYYESTEAIWIFQDAQGILGEV